MTNRTSSAKWIAFRTAFLKELEDNTCAICNMAVDLSLKGNHKMGPTLDHIVPVFADPSLEYDTDNIRLSHKSCNSRKGHKVDYSYARDNQQQPIYQDGTFYCRYDPILDIYVNVGVAWSGTEYEVTFKDGEIVSVVSQVVGDDLL